MGPSVQPLASFLQLQKPVSSVPRAWGGGGRSGSASPDTEVSHQRLLVNFPAGPSLTNAMAMALGPKAGSDKSQDRQKVARGARS